jgi:lipase
VLKLRSWGPPDGPAAVCLHGVTGHGGRFAALAEQLAGMRVVGVDLRGHGGSPWDPPWGIVQHLDDLLATLDALAVDRASWIGHSFGGRLVAELAAHAPERVDRAVLLDPALSIDRAVALERAELMREDTSFASPAEAIDARLSDGSLFTTPRAILEAEADVHLGRGDDGRYRWRFSPPAVIVAWSEMAAPPPPWPSCPTLVVVGAQSWITVDVPDLPQVETVTVPGGHSVLWDDFDATADAVTRFLAG